VLLPFSQQKQQQQQLVVPATFATLSVESPTMRGLIAIKTRSSRSIVLSTFARRADKDEDDVKQWRKRAREKSSASQKRSLLEKGITSRRSLLVLHACLSLIPPFNQHDHQRSSDT
jgi:hypothetical protein